MSNRLRSWTLDQSKGDDKHNSRSRLYQIPTYDEVLGLSFAYPSCIRSPTKQQQ